MSDPVVVVVAALFVVLYALALRLCVRLIAPERSEENTLARALAVAAGLSVLSGALSIIGEVSPWLTGLAMLAVWMVVVSWAYRLDWVDTVIVAVAMLIVSVTGVVCLDLVIGLTVA